MKKNNILVFIPAKDEELTIDQVIDGSITAIERFIGYCPSVLVIDDGSKDNTSEIAQKRGAMVLRHNKSRGLGNIFQEAIQYAISEKIEIMITIDGDGQFSPEDIPVLLRPILEKKADFVTGCRFFKDSNIEGIPRAKKYGNWMMSLIISSILGQKYQDVSCGFRVYNREALLSLNLFGDFTYTQEVFLNLGFKKMKIMEISVHVRYFKNRQSRIAHNLFHYAWQVIKIIFKSVIYYRPLRAFGILSFFLLVIGLPIMTILGVRYLLTDTITPYKAIGIVSLILVIMSLVSFVVGMILQLLSRIQMNIDKILYHERKRE